MLQGSTKYKPHQRECGKAYANKPRIKDNSEARKTGCLTYYPNMSLAVQPSHNSICSLDKPSLFKAVQVPTLKQ